MTKVNGELISVDDSAYDGFKGMTVYGNTVQNLWVNPSGTSNGVTVTSNDDGSMTIGGTSTAQAAINKENVVILKPSTTYTFSVDKQTPSGARFRIGVNYDEGKYVECVASVDGATFTTPSVVYRSVFQLAVDTGVTVSGTYRVMLNEGSEAEPWCPPGLNSVGDSGSVEFVTAGKNLLAPPPSDVTMRGVTLSSDTESQTFSVHGTNTGQAFGLFSFPLGNINSAARTGRLKIVTNIPVVGALYFQVNDADLDGTNIRSVARFGNGSNETLIDLPTTRRIDAIFLGVATREAVNLDGLWVAIVPEEYRGEEHPLYADNSSSTIDLDGHTLNSLPDGTRDELHIDGGGNVVLEKRTQTIQLDGDGNWGTYGSPFRHYTSAWSNYGGSATGYSSDRHFVDKLPASSAVANGLYSANPNGTHAYLRDPVFASDAAGVKTWMGANKPVAILPLLKPQTIQLGKISLPKLRKKPLVNNIWANGTASDTGFSLAPEIDYEYNQWSTYCDGFRTHGKHSYFDMGCCIAARDTGTPEKKSVTATVPYMSGFYDLSKLYGAIAFEARELMYRFEFVEDSRDELQQRKSQFLEWLSQVHDEEIADDDIPGRHFIGSLSEWEFEEGEEGQSGSLEVTFNCQPFLEADEDTTKTCNAGSNTVTVNGQAVNAYAKTSSGTATIRIGGVTQSVGTTEIRLSVQLQPGDNAVTVTGSPVVLRWKELTV